MGGSGGGYFPKTPSKLHDLIDRAQDTAERQQLDADVNRLLQDTLARANQRDPSETRGQMNQLRQILGKRTQIEQLLLAGSVAKNTYVDELSDIDALAVLDPKDVAGKTPQEVLKGFHELLSHTLAKDLAKTVKKGDLAVTITYRDGTEIQLLPALRSGDRVSIPRPDGSGWNQTRPRVFQSLLTKANTRLNGSLVPTIKLMKKIIASLPKQRQVTGYHCECLGLAAAKDYQGPKTCKALLVHVLDHAAKRVTRPIRDVTGQSRVADEYLGKANSTQRRAVADALAGVARRLNAATTVDQWSKILGES